MAKTNAFISQLGKNDTLTENGALAHSSTGSILADQFSKAASFRGRELTEVFIDQNLLHNHYGEMALRFVFYLRMITRKMKGLFESETVQKGQGNRDESFKRYLWYAVNHPETFYENLPLFMNIGSVKDAFDLLFLANENKIELNYERVFDALTLVSENKDLADLFRKYMPAIKSNAKNTTSRSTFRTMVAKKLAKYMELSYADYRKMKSEGKAHTWQQMISKKLFERIQFNKISGRALTLLVSGKFLKRQNLEAKYLEWIKKQPVAKFTGYVYELSMKISHKISEIVKLTLNKQFDGLIELAKKDRGGILGNVWVAVDSSSSMETKVANGSVSAMTVAKSLGVYFATLNEGAFHKHIIKFSSRSVPVQLKGDFCDMYVQTHSGDCPSNTDFQSVIDCIVRIRKSSANVPLEDYPQTLIVVSDMQFDPSKGSAETNHQTTMKKLSEVFPEEWVKNFRVIWWDCTGRCKSNHPSRIDEGGTYVFSGFDGSIITLLLGGSSKEKQNISMEESIEEVLNQEILMNCSLK